MTDPSAASRGVDPARVADGLIRSWRARGFRSADPYDGLATPFVREAAGVPRPVRLALVQLHKRSPVDLRPLFRIPPARDAYATGLFGSASSRLCRAGGAEDLRDVARECREWLVGARVGGGWTYPFDVQTRTFFYPSTTPNVVSTAFAARAFVDAARLEGDAAAADVALDAAEFCRSRLLRRDGGGTWFAYLPGDSDLIHNANLLAARLCAQAGALAGADDLVEAALAAAGATLAAQRPDGSFPYGEGPRLAWVDGHHTGFVLECLADLADAGLPAGDAIRAGAEFYARELFAPDGAPRQRPGRDGAADAIAGAQGIETFARLGDTSRATRIARWMLRFMRRSDGGFVFQRGRLHRKVVPYARWSDAPMASALAALAERSPGP